MVIVIAKRLIFSLYSHFTWSESRMSRDGFHARSHEGCFIWSVHVSDVNKGNRGVILVNQRPTALPCKTQKINNQTGCIGKVCPSEKLGKKLECSERVPKPKNLSLLVRRLHRWDQDSKELYPNKLFAGKSEVFPVWRHSFRKVARSWHLAVNGFLVSCHVTMN